jgi:hypothetical protein
MVTKVKADRARVIGEFGKHCVLCGEGPLIRRALHVVHDLRVDRDPVPMCLHCRNMLEAQDLESAVCKAAKRHAKAYDRLASVAIRAGLGRFPAPPKGVAG